MINRKLDQFSMSPARAILLQSPGRKPWVRHWYTFIEPCKGGTFPTNAKTQTATTQNKCSRRKCRSYGAQSAFICVYPRVSFRALPSLHPGLCRSVVPTALTSAQPTNPTTNANNHTEQPIRQQAQITTPNNKRKSLGCKSLGFERNCRPTLKGYS